MNEKINELLTRGVEEVIEIDSLKKKFESGKKLRIKLGIDPTSPNIHLGRAVPLMKLRDFQNLGHKIVLIIGDFTGVIGDTSDKDSERPMLTSEIIKKNLEKYIEQAGKIIDIDKCEIRYNSEWLRDLTYNKIGEQADVFSVNNFIARENIKKRLDEGRRVSLREVLYPIMQGYDSVAIKADVELGGTDQRFNLLAGRDLQKHFGQAPQDIITNTLIEGTDGRKMSSSWGNTINLTDSANEMFGKIMSIKDELIVKYFELLTRVPMDEVKVMKREMLIGKLNPRDAKIRLAKEIVTLLHTKNVAEKAEKSFVDTFSKGEIPTDIEEVKLEKGQSVMQLLVSKNIVSSGSEWRRLVENGAVKTADGNKINEINFAPTKETILRIGKKTFVKIVL
ncbi:MAG: tyrosine--tRNA ligase [Patescibacteria group bacterium]